MKRELAMIWAALCALCLVAAPPAFASEVPSAGDEQGGEAVEASRPGQRRPGGRARPAQRGRAPYESGTSRAVLGAELDLPASVRTAVLNNELLRRLEVASRMQRFSGSAPGGGRWQTEALGAGEAVPVTVGFSSGVLRVMARRDGSLLWLGSGHVEEPAAVLRLGDLMPLLEVIGIRDRELTLSTTSVSFGGGAVPPAYTMTFRMGRLHHHKAALQRAQREGRVAYSLVTGTVTVMGALVTADAEGELRVRKVSTEGDHRQRFSDTVMPEACRPLEQALAGGEPASAVRQARALLEQTSIVQACAARYLALAVPEQAPGILRGLLSTGRIAQPREVIEALTYLDQALSQANLRAVVDMLGRGGLTNAEAVCLEAPLGWTYTLLDREDVSEVNKRVMRRCLR